MPLDTRLQKWLPLSLNPQATSHPGLPFPELGKVYAEHQFRYLQPSFQALLSSYDQSCEKQVSCLNGRSSCSAAPERSLKSSQKRFLIFDQSRNHTRLLQCGFPMAFPSSMAAEPGKTLDSLNLEISKDHAIPAKILLHEDDVNGQEESEMHEDTEEINALLYSDDEDCESDEDEVMSTGQSPFPFEQQACNKTSEEHGGTQSNDDGPCCKRQKLLDHSYRDSSPSFAHTKSFTRLKCLSGENLHESNISSKHTSSGLSDEQSRRDKIHTALRILESVVPDAKRKEALLLLDEAIDYLKLLKQSLKSSKGLNNHW